MNLQRVCPRCGSKPMAMNASSMRELPLWFLACSNDGCEIMTRPHVSRHAAERDWDEGKVSWEGKGL